MRFSVIVGFRNRDIDRVKRSLDSIKTQSLQDFELIFVDYGSDGNISVQVKELLTEYDFARCLFEDSRGKFWNRAHALNIGIKRAKGEVCVLWDIDLIVGNTFLEHLSLLSFEKEFTSHDCYYLSENWQLSQNADYNFDKIAYVGLMVVATTILQSIGGFDEFYMIWGVEDDDLQNRLLKYGLNNKKVNVSELAVYHQWHPEADVVFHEWWYLAMLHYSHSNRSIIRNNLRYGEQDTRAQHSMVSDTMKIYEFNLWDSSRLRFLPFYNDFHTLEAGMKGQLLYENRWTITGKLQPVVNALNLTLRKSKWINYLLVRKEMVEAPKYTSFSDVYQWLCWFVGEHRHLLKDYNIEISNENISFSFIKR